MLLHQTSKKNEHVCYRVREDKLSLHGFLHLQKSSSLSVLYPTNSFCRGWAGCHWECKYLK